MRVPAPTQSLIPPGRSVLVYDGDCDFCRWAARWVAARAHPDLEILPFAEVPRERWLTALTDSQVAARAHFITPAGVELHGGAALTSALRLTRYAGAARFLDRLSLVREVGYAAVARTRGVWSRLVR